MHTLTLEVLGTLFLAIAVVLGAEAVRQYRLYANSEASVFWALMALAFALLMLVFGVQSFWKARSLRK